MGRHSIKRFFFVAVALAMAAAAEAGDATRVASSPALAVRGYHYAGSGFAQAPAGSGMVHPQAVIARFADAPVTLTVAIDTNDPSARLPEVVRFNFTGGDDFSKAISLPMREVTEDQDGVSCKIGPDVIRAMIGGKELPLSVRGSYYKPTEGPRWLILDLCTACQAKVSFGEATYTVQVVDGDGNLQPGDKVQPVISGGRVAGRTGGDSVVIDLGDGTFSGNLLVGFYGQPIRVGDSWYDVSLSEDRSHISAAKIDVPSGKIRLANDNWEGIFISEKYVIVLFDGMAGQPVDMPVGRYFVKRYRQRFGPGEPLLGKVINETPSRNGGPFLLNGREPSFAIPLARVADVVIGTPLKVAGAAAKGEDGSYVLSARVTDASGAGNVSVIDAEGKTPEAFIRVLDAAGNEVHRARMQYERRGNYSYAWRAPEGVKGQFALVPEYQVPPLKVELVKGTVEVN